jgi:hypothetical protein
MLYTRNMLTKSIISNKHQANTLALSTAADFQELDMPRFKIHDINDEKNQEKIEITFFNVKSFTNCDITKIEKIS